MPVSTITVDISQSQITFTDPNGQSVSFEPVVYVVPGAPALKVVAVGSPPPPGTHAWRVEVFSDQKPLAGVSKLACMIALMAHGLRPIHDRPLLQMKPEVLVRGADSLLHFGGYERDLIAHSLQEAGARRVRWPEDLPND